MTPPRESNWWIVWPDRQTSTRGSYSVHERKMDDLYPAAATSREPQPRGSYSAFDQQEKLGEPPWTGPTLEAWEQAHGHDARLKCYPEFGCQVIEERWQRLIEFAEWFIATAPRELATGGGFRPFVAGAQRRAREALR